MEYTTEKTGYSKTHSVWNFVVPGEKSYKTVGWAVKRAQRLANKTGKEYCISRVNTKYRIVRHDKDLKPQHRGLVVRPQPRLTVEVSGIGKVPGQFLIYERSGAITIEEVANLLRSRGMDVAAFFKPSQRPVHHRGCRKAVAKSGTTVLGTLYINMEKS